MTKYGEAGELPGDASTELVRSGLALLEANAIDGGTRPGRLYPHQWSWDAAAIAMGRARWDQVGAERELRSLFAAQWSDGLLPHIRFTDAGGYFPGPDYWQAERSPCAPAGVRTSGIVQPPIHATAAWRVFLRARDRDRADLFLRELFPRLAAWHEYLYRERQRDGDGLVEVWHPWETGMDNSPAWDHALRRITVSPGDVPSYRRLDVEGASAPEGRPTDFEYDRYAYLVHLFRELDWDSARIRAATPFAVQPVLLNALLVQAGRDLARIARRIGADPRPYEAQADATGAGIDKLWDPDACAYLDRDVLGGRLVERCTATGFAPLFAGVPRAERAVLMVERLAGSLAPLEDGRVAVCSIAPDEHDFEPALYWRGPVWPILQWVSHHGAERYGFADLASGLRDTMLQLARRNGFWEHYNPLTGEGQGELEFSWTVGFVLDLIDRIPIEGEQVT